MNIVLFSQKFNPGHINWVSGYFKLFLEAGHTVKCYLDEEYYKFMPEVQDYKIASKSELLDFSPDILWIINPSEKHLIFSLWLKTKCHVKIYYYYHEPFPGLELFREGKKSFRALLAYTISSLICLISYQVVLPSVNSLQKYQKYSKWLNRNNVMLPLLYEDDKPDDCNEIKRKYFSFIGTFAESHGTEFFVTFLKYAVKYDDTISFLIATRSDISKLLEDPEIKKLKEKGRLHVQHGRSMTTSEINNYYLQSICVWNIYTRSNQSGVLPNALMMGTPVLASDSGVFTEIVKEGKNGFVIKDINNCSEILNRYKTIADNIDEFESNARDSFINHYYYKSWVTSINSYLS